MICTVKPVAVGVAAPNVGVNAAPLSTIVTVFVPVNVSVPQPVFVSVLPDGEMFPLISRAVPVGTCTVRSFASAMLLEIWWPVPDCTVMVAGLVIVNAPLPVLVTKLPLPINVNAVSVKDESFIPNISVPLLASVPIKTGVVDSILSSKATLSVP